MTHIENGAFGDPTSRIDELLLCAYKDFKGYCKSMRIECSQLPFTPGLATYNSV